MKEFFASVWAKCVEWYGMYSDFIHSILPREVGDLAEYVLDIAIVAGIVFAIGRIAFSTNNNG